MYNDSGEQIFAIVRGHNVAQLIQLIAQLAGVLITSVHVMAEHK